jgi:hypothetical protein
MGRSTVLAAPLNDSTGMPPLTQPTTTTVVIPTARDLACDTLGGVLCGG